MTMIYYIVEEVWMMMMMMMSRKRASMWHQSINTSLLSRQESQRVLSWMH
jgi:hypothetical protein